MQDRGRCHRSRLALVCAAANQLPVEEINLKGLFLSSAWNFVQLDVIVGQ